MPSFAYSAINSQGVEHSGEIQAPDLYGGTRRAPRQRAARADDRRAHGAGVPRGADVHGHRREGQAEVPADLLAPVRDDDRSGSLGRHGARDPRAADRRQGAREDHRRRARAGRRRVAPLGGDVALPGCLQPPVHRDGRGRRGRRRSRCRARPGRDADREGGEDQAPGQGRDDLPVRRRSPLRRWS